MLFTDGFLCSCCKMQTSSFYRISHRPCDCAGKKWRWNHIIESWACARDAPTSAGSRNRHLLCRCTTKILGIHIVYTPIHKSSFPRYMSGFETWMFQTSSTIVLVLVLVIRVMTWWPPRTVQERSVCYTLPVVVSCMKRYWYTLSSATVLHLMYSHSHSIY